MNSRGIPFSAELINAPECRLSGQKQTWPRNAVTSAFTPKLPFDSIALDTLFRPVDQCVPGPISGVTMDLGGWLRSLGLERYETAFRENEIDETVLVRLTHET